MGNMKDIPQEDRLDLVSRIIHFGLMVIGVLAWLSGYGADDYKHLHHPGFSLHSFLGVGLTFFVTLRLIYGVIGPEEARFSHWVPYTKARVRLVGEDIINLFRLKLPERPARQGLAGLVETCGLLVFSWMALTGTWMFLYLEPGRKARGMLHFIKEGHEMGEWLVPIFLGIHGGAVLLHALFGQHLWKKVFFLER